MSKWQGFRHPRTTQERRFNQEGWERPRRRNLPNAWDDVHKYSDLSWKNYRKHQSKTWGFPTDEQKKDGSAYSCSMSNRNHWHLEHALCRYRRRRCQWCIANDIWEDINRIDWHEQKRQEQEQQKILELRLLFPNIVKRHHNY